MEMSATTTIRRPPAEVWAYVMDVGHDADWRTGVDESGWLEEGPIGPGSEGYTRAGTAEVGWRVFALTDGQSVDWDLLSGPLKGRGGYRVLPVEGGTEFTLVADVEPTGAYRLLGPLFGRMGRKQNQADVEKLRDILEGEGA
jgi:hypothetical protein